MRRYKICLRREIKIYDCNIRQEFIIVYLQILVDIIILTKNNLNIFRITKFFSDKGISKPLYFKNDF